MALGRLLYRLTALVDILALTGVIWAVAEGVLGIELRPWMLVLGVLVGIAHNERQLRLRGPRQVRLLGLVPLAPRRWFSDPGPTAEGRIGGRSPDR